jgi:hypothetical protein
MSRFRPSMRTLRLSFHLARLAAAAIARTGTGAADRLAGGEPARGSRRRAADETLALEAAIAAARRRRAAKGPLAQAFGGLHPYTPGTAQQNGYGGGKEN